MKKLLITLMAFGFSFAEAMSFPAVGDKAVYHAEIESASSMVNQYESSIEITAIDQATSSMTIAMTVTYGGGQVKSSSKNVSLYHYSDLASAVDRCVALSGKLETVSTPAGTFNCCRVDQNASGMKMSLWYAKVPFGLVKSVSESGGVKSTLTLTSVVDR